MDGYQREGSSNSRTLILGPESVNGIKEIRISGPKKANYKDFSPNSTLRRSLTSTCELCIPKKKKKGDFSTIL